MPPWRHLSDEELADVLTYVLDRFGGQPDRRVAPATIGAAR
jgi:mono/diheme cytochrome c family protein